MWNNIITHPFFYQGLLLAGLFLCALSIYLFYRTVIFLGNSETANGKIIDLIRNGVPYGHEDSVTWEPVVRFEDASGAAQQFQCYGSQKAQFSWGISKSAEPEFKVGEVVTVIYDKNNPQRAKIKQWKRMWLIPIVLGMFGVGLVWHATT